MTRVNKNLFVALSILIYSVFHVISEEDDSSRSFEITNKYAHPIELYWVGRNGDLPKLGEIVRGQTAQFNSFIGHAFEVRDINCSDEGGVCRFERFTVNKNHDQLFYVTEGLNIEMVDDSIMVSLDAQNMTLCEEQSKSDLLQGGPVAALALRKLRSCVKGVVANELKDVRDKIRYQSELREHLADSWENYTCADNDLETSKAIKTKTWIHKGIGRQVSVLHNKTRSKIHVVSNFISDEECQAMQEAAAPSLHDATVADSSGGSELSASRKAKQAGIRVPWDKEKDNNPIAALSRRVYDYTNHVTGFNIKEHGQEDLMSIQYFGRGENDTEPDRYKPHCDGDCTGLPHKPATRFATMVMYCEVADKGGATNFKNAGVHVKPVKNAGLFFLYRGDDGIMDKGFTTHSGCPVILGSKKLVTQWIRLGVDEQNRWSDFNTLGVKLSDVD